MEFDLPTIVNALMAIIGAGSVYGGGLFAYNKYQSNRNTNQANWSVEQSENGFSNMGTTGQIPALDFVTGDECRETKKGITDSIHEVKVEVSKGMERLSKKMDGLSKTVGQTREALAKQEANVLKAVGFGIREHENRYNHQSGGTKPGS